jgi:Protein of unknown function (DUF1329)
MTPIFRVTIVCAWIASAATALAAVSADEASQLGNTLMPWGAEKSGNKEGTIPAYTDGQVRPPAGFDPKNPRVRPDPYAEEKPLYSVTAENMAQHAGKLSDGTKALLQKYPGFRIDVYPTHRTQRYPDHVNERSIRNATACRTTTDGLALEGCYGGVPFPIPKTGNEVMWNHNLRYQSPSYLASFRNMMIDSGGGNNLQGQIEIWQEYPAFYPENNAVLSPADPYWLVRVDFTGPPRKAGEKLVLIDYVDPIKNRRKVWQYLPGQRRVKLTPELAYDTPNPASGGAALMDEATVFNGGLDRFDFKLLGKKEMLIPYNAFRLFDEAACPDQKRYLKGHPSPDCLRWELHRVWEVEATLKPGARHVYAKRKFYFDEDQPEVGTADGYDAAGKLYRTVFGIYFPFYETADQGFGDPTITFDFQTGAYLVQADFARGYFQPAASRQPARVFTGDAMAAEGLR